MWVARILLFFWGAEWFITGHFTKQPDAVPSLKESSLKILIGNLAPLNVEWYSWPPIKEPCRSGGTGRRKGLKIPRFERTVPVQVRSPAPRPLLLLHIVSIEP